MKKYIKIVALSIFAIPFISFQLKAKDYKVSVVKAQVEKWINARLTDAYTAEDASLLRVQTMIDNIESLKLEISASGSNDEKVNYKIAAVKMYAGKILDTDNVIDD